jgi:hypothetical protein
MPTNQASNRRVAFLSIIPTPDCLILLTGTNSHGCTQQYQCSDASPPDCLSECLDLRSHARQKPWGEK